MEQFSDAPAPLATTAGFFAHTARHLLGSKSGIKERFAESAVL